ncbi:MAG: PAS domain S-box protein [Sporocytophaga sp.]|uniref:PAS domain S-box protein n=1 Tax=Sporocytophaga sp. TaxID=2231183 RepID=UPI001B165046|nr:PAS domain S-box protein [Sporocytophaga sp.]MBO9703064.1 PAS domain S-box protein [Sporocytophaga sp.]
MSVSIENKQTVNTLITIGKTFILIAFLIPIIGLILRAINYEWFELFSFKQTVSQNPLSAICYAMIAIAIWIIRNENASFRSKLICNIICFFVMIIAAGKLITYFMNRPFLLEVLLFKDQIYHVKSKIGKELNANLLSLISSFFFITLCLSLLLNNYGNKQIYKISQILNYITALCAILAIYCYVYKIDELIATSFIIPISLNSAICALLLSLGILFLRPHKGSMQTLIGQNSTQIVLLRFLAFFVPLLLGWLKIKGEDNGVYSKNMGTALYASATFCISMFLLGWKSKIQSKLREVRQKNEEQIEKDRDKLKNILELSPTTITIIDLNTQKYIYTNRASRQLFRYKGSDLRNKKYQDVVKTLVAGIDEDKIRNRLDLIKKLNEDESNEMTYGIYNTKGLVSWIITKGIGFDYKNGKAQKALINGLDISKEMKLQLALERQTAEIEQTNKKLRESNDKLRDIQLNLEEKIKERIYEIEESNRACKDFFEESFEGILRYGLKDIEGVDINLPIKQQITLIQKHAYIAEANKKFIHDHGYKSKDELVGTPLIDFLAMSDNEKIKLTVGFIKNGYKMENVTSAHLNKAGEKVKFLVNMTGVIDNGLLISAWSTEMKLVNINQ